MNSADRRKAVEQYIAEKRSFFGIDDPGPNVAMLCDIGLVDSLKKQIAFISWFRLEFEDVEMGGPAMGDCQNDTMMVQNKMILFLQFNKRIDIYLIDVKPRWLEWTRSLKKLSQAPSVEHSLDNTVSIN